MPTDFVLLARLHIGQIPALCEKTPENVVKISRYPIQIRHGGRVPPDRRHPCLKRYTKHQQTTCRTGRTSHRGDHLNKHYSHITGALQSKANMRPRRTYLAHINTWKCLAAAMANSDCVQSGRTLMACSLQYFWRVRYCWLV